MKITFRYTLLISIIAAFAGLISAFPWIFHNFQSSSDLPKSVSIVETNKGKNTHLGSLKFESGIKKKISDTNALNNPGKASDSDTLNTNNLLFHYNPYLLIWGLTIVVIIGLASGALPLIVDRIWNIHKVFAIKPWILGLLIVGIAFIGAVMYFSLSIPNHLSYYTFWTPFADVIFKDHGIMNCVVIVILILALPSLLGIALLFIAGQKFQNGLKNNLNETKENFLEKYKELRNALSFFLIILTILITLTVIATGAFRQALLTAIVVEGLDIAPIEYVYLYGVFFTIFLALFYAPVYLQLLNLKEQTESNSELEQFKDDKLLQVSNREIFKILISLLAPLLSSILPGFLS